MPDSGVARGGTVEKPDAPVARGSEAEQPDDPVARGSEAEPADGPVASPERPSGGWARPWVRLAHFVMTQALGVLAGATAYAAVALARMLAFWIEGLISESVSAQLDTLQIALQTGGMVVVFAAWAVTAGLGLRELWEA